MTPKGQVLLVEDDLDLMDLYRTLLRCAGYEIWGAARSGEDAIRRLSVGQGDLPDVMILDYRLPGCDGLEVARLALARYPGVKIIMTTADESAREEARRLGISRFKSKPVSNALLLRNIDEAIQEGAGAG